MAVIMTGAFPQSCTELSHRGPRRFVCAMPAGRLLGFPVLQEPCTPMKSRPEDRHFIGSCHWVLLMLWIMPASVQSQELASNNPYCAAPQAQRGVRGAGESPYSSQRCEDIVRDCSW